MNSNTHHFQELRPRIIVMGVGGAGGNAVNNMIASGLQGVEFVAANTDAQALSMSGADVRFQLGANLTEGLGAGSNPEIGEGAAEEVLDEMRQLLEGANMVFVACGMGGGTGTGAAPVVARVAQDMGVLTVAVVTKPFHFEGRRRMRIAEAGIEQLRKHVDTMIVIPNQNLFRLANEQTTFADSFRLADQVLNSGVSCVTDLIMKEGLINLDFADVKTVITEMGAAVMGTGLAHGENRAEKAAEEAISNPLIDDISLAGAKGLLISISGGADMTLFEVDEVASRIRREVDPDANIIVGATFDDHLQGHLRVSLVASGLNHAHPQSMHEEADRVRMEQDTKLEQEGLKETGHGLNDRLKELEQKDMRPLGGQNGPGKHPPMRPGMETGVGTQMPPAARGGGQSKGHVQIKNRPPRFMSDNVHGEPGGQGGFDERGQMPNRDDLAQGRSFVARAPQAVQRPVRRMPRVDELPVTGQNQLRAYQEQKAAVEPVEQKKKVGFFDRITGRNRAQEEPDQQHGSGYETVQGDEVPLSESDYQAQAPVVDGYGQRPPEPAPLPVQNGKPGRQDFADPDLDGHQGAVGYHEDVVLPSDNRQERYPTIEVPKHSPEFDHDAGEDEPIADIPPFLRKNNN